MKLKMVVFTLCVFSTSCALEKEASTFYKRLTDQLFDALNSLVMSCLRCHLSFAILSSVV